MTLQLDRSSAERFVSTLTGSPETVVTFQTFVEGAAQGSGKGRILHAPLASAWPHLCYLQEHGHGVFLMVNEGDLNGRSTANVTAVRALFYDADVEPWPDPANLSPPPSMIVSSGRGRHGYWLMQRSEQLADFSPAQRAIAERLGTDSSVVDAPRVMRLPGTFHLKDRNHPRLVELTVCDRSRRYTVREVLAGLGVQPVGDFGLTSIVAGARPKLSSEATPLVASDARDRAEAYIGKIHAVQHQGGDTATFRVAAALRHDFGLDVDTAWVCGFRPSRSAIPADADHPFRQGDHPGRDAAG